jgi:hypothetical protein
MEFRQNFFFAGRFIVHFPSEFGQYLFKKILIEVYIISKVLIYIASSDVSAVISLFFFQVDIFYFF